MSCESVDHWCLGKLLGFIELGVLHLITLKVLVALTLFVTGPFVVWSVNVKVVLTLGCIFSAIL